MKRCMRAVDLIAKKRDGEALSKEEIDFLIDNYSTDDPKNKIPDYQMSALLMAIVLNGMDKRETADLTRAMIKSGDTISLSGVKGVKIDKHSSGGVGDKVTLVIAPLCAACGVVVPKLSGRGLGHTGGTIDKLESIKSIDTNLSKKRFISQLNMIGCAIAGKMGNVAKADKLLYALRDVTGTVDSLPLIASSIMSKKLAIKSNGIVLDVKVGSGALMKSKKRATELAKLMVSIGKQHKRKTRAIITDMSQPLGRAIGNAIEVAEAVDTLVGRGPRDLERLCIKIASQMLILAKKARNNVEAEEKLHRAIASGKAYRKFAAMVKAQKGRLQLPKAKTRTRVSAKQTGYIKAIKTAELGTCAMRLGAGRDKKGAKIDYAAGIYLHKKIGDKVEKGDKICTLLHKLPPNKAKIIKKDVLDCFLVSRIKPLKRRLLHGIVK